ncbi:short chain dehydrogenase [Thermoflavimicrobium daqui]|uniref:Short chain dehydrogenase n=2 Tax=Thermoflavimicrobium daqui TaxID=2137476 RepID=A0A364K4T3_9BACL|nr:SDR family oxidoreductase [Thermoflavimicrobium daqui]RAL24301.1 short chain dehydrogenase [Thermoflavimicrobium daqui]
MDLQGKRVVVLGGSSGMGLATAQAVVHQGGHVVIASRSEEKLKKAQEQIRKNVEIITLDVTNEHDMENFFQKIGKFDHLVSTAAGGPTGNFLDLPIQDAKKTFAAKYWGQYFAAKYGAPFIKDGGSITFCTGVLARKPAKGFSILSTINGGIEALARALAVELSPIRVNVVSPGIVDTPLYDKMSSEEREDYFVSIANQVPVKRVGKPEDVAEAFLYLMTNSFTTGTTLHVDGGYSLV